MPTIRQSFIAKLTRLYPLYSGCGTLANKSFIHKLAGISNEQVWSPTDSGEILASLDEYIGRSVFYVGDLDRKITWIINQIVRPGDTVLDIGANIGLTTLLLSKLVGKNGKVHSFEPNPELLKMLKKTLDHNQVSNVCLHEIALGSEESELELRIPRFKQNNQGCGSLVRYKNLNDCDTFKVPVRPLSTIVTEKGIKSIRLIKIDVEGFESEVLGGAEEVLRKILPEAILFELNEKLEGSVRDQPIIKILHDCGYGFFSVPKCLFRMHLKRFDLDKSHELIGHDFLAVPKGELYESIAKLVRASV
ncbi:MAG: FkbM family methyltransferase [Microcoleaceae cyanobacterium]